MLLKIPCPHCNRVTSVESEKLPDQPVSFKCPHCKGKVHVDKIQLIAAAKEGKAPSRPTLVSSAVPELARTGDSPAAGETKATDWQANGLPPGAVIPPGIILGEDPALIERIRTDLGRYDCDLETPLGVEEARSQILLEPPSLVIYVAGKAGGPPHEPLVGLTSVPPQERRKIFLVIVAENLKTLDGNAAFMYQVNLCVSHADVGLLASSIYAGLDYHHRLYKPFMDVQESG